MPKVFISYSHKDEQWKDRLQTQLAVLEMEGLLSVWQDRQIELGDSWYPAIEQELNTADVAILLISADFLTSKFIRGDEIPRLLERREKEGIRVIPLILKPCPWRKVKWLSAMQGASRDNVELSGLSEHEQDAVLCRLAEKIHDLMVDCRQPVGLKPEPQAVAIHIDRLPTVAGGFFGRKEELALLDAALEDTLTPQPHLPPSGRGGARIRIIQFIAAGGTGKTKLLRHWLNQHEADIPNRIVWSFYSQGSAEDKQVSASPFFIDVFNEFGVDQTQFKTEEEKADALVKLLIDSKTLLVLDGLEPLQHVGKGMDGRLKDRAITRLLQKLAAQHSSLCIITTRIRVHDISDRPHVQSMELDNLQPTDGVALLQSLGVKGVATELDKTVREYGCHALALHLLGNALTTYLHGDIHKRDTLDELLDEYADTGRHAFKVMQAYQQWLQGTPELQLLYLLGLFDHPIETEVLEVLWQAQIPGLTTDIPRKAWLNAIRNLREKHRLLSTHEGRPDLLDCHPLIREYFGGQLQTQQPEVWRQAHERLYEYYKALPEKLYGKFLPDTLEEMQPLFSAVAHGCTAGLHQQALDEVFWTRIHRPRENYIFNNLCAFDDALSILAYFFVIPWCKLHPNLSKNTKELILNYTSINLSASGRIREAVIVSNYGFETAKTKNNIEALVLESTHLSRWHLMLGEIINALKMASTAIKYIKEQNELHTNDWLLRTLLAQDALVKAYYQKGDKEKTSSAFRKMIPIYRKHPAISSIKHTHLEILLSQNQTDKVIRKIKFTFKSSHNKRGMFELLLGRALKLKIDLPSALYWVNQSLMELRISGIPYQIPEAILERSSIYRQTGDFARARQDLQEVFDIAEPSGMRLHLTDYHLEMARLLLAEAGFDSAQPSDSTLNEKSGTTLCLSEVEGNMEQARTHIEAAAKLINETGYHRRDAELAELQQHLIERKLP